MGTEKKLSVVVEKILDMKITRMFGMSLFCIVLMLAIILVVGLLWSGASQYKSEILFSAIGIGVLVGGYWGAKMKPRELYPF